MRYMEQERNQSRTIIMKLSLLSTALLVSGVAGCGGGGVMVNTSTPSLPSPQTYLVPVVGNIGFSATGPQTYTFDDSANTYTERTYQLNGVQQEGAQVISSGVFTSDSSRGLLSLGLTASYAFDSSIPRWVATTYNPPETGGFALQLAGQAGGFVQLLGQPVAPIVPSTTCPTNTTPQTYQFLTLPIYLPSAASTQDGFPGWDPTTQTVYGSVDISASGDTVHFNNVKQFTLPSAGGTGTPSNPAPSSVAGACSTTYYGQTISIPAQAVITDPGNGQTTPPPEIVGIGPSGLLVEDNGSGDGLGKVGGFDLGAGTGAIGLPKPATAIDINTLVGAQYLGFVYGAGVSTQFGNGIASGWSSHPVSFGFPSIPSNCPPVGTSTTALIYGGDFTNDDPTTGTNGFGNCDLAVDLGLQDAGNGGLFANAKVWLFAPYAANTTMKADSFSAVAIAGQLNGKFAIFLLGEDASQPWAIYLLQSN
jgi:hypothetical protein